MDTTGLVMMVGRYIASKVISKMTHTILSSGSLNDTNPLGDVKSLLKSVEDKIPVIQAVIDAAEGFPIKSQTLSNWLKDVKDAAYEVDDLLDELESQKIQQQQQERMMEDKSKVTAAFASSALNFLKCLFISDEKLDKLKSLVGSLDEIFDDVDCKLAELEDSIGRDKASNTRNRETSSFMVEEVIGRERERDRILEMLFHSEDHELVFVNKGAGSSNAYPVLRVIPIVGMGGVGKTALAQLIYNDQRVANRFTRSWVYVSNHDFSIGRIVKELHSTLDPKSVLLSDKLQDLKHEIWNKRFLFVLDDVWEDIGSIWEELRSVLSNSAKGSKVLVTTQSPKVAEMIGNVDPIYLEPLGEEAYWRLFEQCAFGDKEISPNLRDKQEQIARKISQKLHGLPLAAKALGSLLRTRVEEGFWNTILESEWWEEELVKSKILPSLGLNYQHLSANVKQCFAYTSIFPKGYIFCKDRLVHMWMAQGVIQSKFPGTIRLEDIGSQMFDELVKRYFFLPNQNGGYVMHDLIRELVVCVSSDECIVVSDACTEIPTTVRHLCLTATKLDALKELHKFQKLRSLISFRGCYDDGEFFLQGELHDALKNIFKSNKSLRVIDMSYYGQRLEQLPDAICDLPHLRYLDISHSRIEGLPKSIFKLCHLQMLNMNSCYLLRNLPEGINRLINLRHLYAHARTISLIDGIGKLTNLQELEELRVTRKRGHWIGELKELRNIRRRLVLQNLENVENKKEATEARLKDKEHIDQLLFIWDPENEIGESHILEGLEPHQNLKELNIEHYPGLRYPSWLAMKQIFTNLASLFLKDCAKCEVLPPLGQLPSLKILHIWSMPAVKKIGAEFYGDADPAFPSLDELIFGFLEECEEWSEAVGRQLLPHLQFLKIVKCPRLRKVPFVYLRSPLKVLQLWQCQDVDGSDLNSFLQIQTSLVTLELQNWFRSASVSFSNLTNVQRLELRNCPELRLNGGIQILSKLQDLIVIKCPNLIEPLLCQVDSAQILSSLSCLHTDESLLDSVWIALGRVPSLRKLEICGCIHHWKTEQEEWFQQLTSLEDLKFVCCKNLVSLPDSLSGMHCLKRLEIYRSLLISSLPELLRLEELLICHCPTLEERCTRPHGLDWPKVARIPHVTIIRDYNKKTLFYSHGE